MADQIMTVSKERLHRSHGVAFSARNARRGHRRESAWALACKPDGAPQPGVAVVFAYEPQNNQFDGPVILGIEWREEDKNKPGYPLGWKDDFGEPLWSQ